MKPLFLAALLALACTPAFAAYPKPDNTPLPPPQYEGYRGKVVTIIRSWPEINRLCQDKGTPYEEAWACQRDTKAGCVIYLPRIDGSLVNYEGWVRLYRHERAHCGGPQGWPADHPGARHY